jgi:hypothetical protein
MFLEGSTVIKQEYLRKAFELLWKKKIGPWQPSGGKIWRIRGFETSIISFFSLLDTIAYIIA